MFSVGLRGPAAQFMVRVCVSEYACVCGRESERSELACAFLLCVCFFSFFFLVVVLQRHKTLPLSAFKSAC